MTMHSGGSTLVLFPGALGDLLCARPTFLALRQRSTNGLTLLTRDAFFPLAAVDGFRPLSIDRREVAELFSTAPLSAAARTLFAGYAEIHSWTGHADPHCAAKLASLASGAAHLYPFRDLGPREHARAYFARCARVTPLERALIAPAAAQAWAATFTAPATGRLLAIHAGSGSPRKNWLGIREIARRWQERGGDVVEILGPAEADCASAPQALPLRDASLDRVAAVLGAAAFYLGNDSGITHLAAAVRCRGLALFGPTSALHWGPRGGSVRTLTSARRCRACGDSFCTHRLAPDAVWQRLLAIDARRAGEDFNS